MLDHKELAKRSGVHYDTVRALLGPSGGPQDVSLDVMHLIGDACQVPRWFMDHGYSPPPEVISDDVLSRLAELRRQLAQQDARIEELRRQSSNDDAAVALLRRTVDVLLSRLERAPDPGQEFEQELQEAVQQARKRLADNEQGADDQREQDQAS